MTESWRIFVAAPVNDGVRAVMQRTQNRLAPLKWPVRWVDPRLAHVTLRFYGDTAQDDITPIRSSLREIAGRHASLQLQTAGIGAFPSTARPRVVWLGLAGEVRKLRVLATAIDPDAVKVGTRDRAFKAHITLARLRSEAAPLTGFADAVAMLDMPAVALAVDRLQLIRSTLGPKGPTYTVIDEWPLAETSEAPDTSTATLLHEHT